ncbi:MAG: hypothetical protein ACR2F6_02525 [Mycobacteriales bacterium]
MADVLGIEATTDHEYLVRLREGDTTFETRVRATPSVLGQLSDLNADERTIVERTVTFLIHRQLAIDLPPTLDLDDVAAGYDDYLAEMASYPK